MAHVGKHRKESAMTEKRIKTALMLLGEALVIWYGMGTPIPTTLTDWVKLIVSLMAIVYTGWKNHDFTVEAVTGTTITREMKKLRDHVGEYTEEPEDAEVFESEVHIDGNE